MGKGAELTRLTGELALAAEFGTPSRQDWERLVEKVLERAGSSRERLVTTTDDGIEVLPLYTADDPAPPAGFPGVPPFVRGSRPDGHVLEGWDVRALHEAVDVAATNEAVLADLEGGVTSLWLRVGEGGVPVSALRDVLREVRLDLAPVVLDAGPEYERAAEALLALHSEQGVPDTEVAGNLGADPIGLRARTGREHDVAAAVTLTARLADRHPRLSTFVADGLPYHEAGGSDAQELGAVTATAVAYLRALTDAGLDVARAAARIEFRLAATTDQFGTIAKFRAARRVWSRVVEVCGAPGAAMRQHAVTSPAMLTRRDPAVNLLRTTVASFAAGIGGADAVTVLPFDHAIGLPDRFSRRLARNTQAILLEESKLAAVIDPAGGSWFVENLTDALARRAWDEFTAIEKAGGIESELASGALAERLARTWRARSRRIATRRDALTGVSEFPLLEERAFDRAPRPEVTAGGGLPRVRHAQDYERLRDRSDAHLAEHGSRPKVFLATLGSPAEYTARATFAANLFLAGGIEPVNPGVAGASTDELVQAFRDSSTPVACVCGTDTAYTEHAAEVAGALREAGATTVLLAGKPAEGETGGSNGISGYVHRGCDVLAVLTDTLDTLGVAP
ncbi:methylmalonyl-CoA mutase family protein [Saccharomonospora cyanea]|uniref:Methylmalonyl-CoA mutase, N-terminal domain/subunit n=1 Tax=Saccharomonospora cyanea NA-134 TaxID=882082 RepID=H5XHY9_9PSEU|nr:methylmalonyl-CoA mutase family protein [Saccharomonospora cyanea]EHR59595.1 methylmalonyl-CoA mutase, N-terminal domain/subunit [Saccharomonospora cyanea NA-134]